jgi:hypothetical protein
MRQPAPALQQNGHRGRLPHQGTEFRNRTPIPRHGQDLPPAHPVQHIAASIARVAPLCEADRRALASGILPLAIGSTAIAVQNQVSGLGAAELIGVWSAAVAAGAAVARGVWSAMSRGWQHRMTGLVEEMRNLPAAAADRAAIT